MRFDGLAKLKVKGGTRILVLNAPEGFPLDPKEWPSPVEIAVEPGNGPYPAVLLFAKNREELSLHADTAAGSVEEDGLLWICYPKKTSPLYEDLSRDEGWEPVKKLGYEGVSLVALDASWSAMRFRRAGAAMRKKPAAQPSGPAEQRADIEMPGDLKEKLYADKEAAAIYDALAPSYKRAFLDWVVSAKRSETREKRIGETVTKLKAGYKNPHMGPKA